MLLVFVVVVVVVVLVGVVVVEIVVLVVSEYIKVDLKATFRLPFLSFPDNFTIQLRALPLP